jgi:hypothetical protein
MVRLFVAIFLIMLVAISVQIVVSTRGATSFPNRTINYAVRVVQRASLPFGDSVPGGSYAWDPITNPTRTWLSLSVVRSPRTLVDASALVLSYLLRRRSPLLFPRRCTAGAMVFYRPSPPGMLLLLLLLLLLLQQRRSSACSALRGTLAPRTSLSRTRT